MRAEVALLCQVRQGGGAWSTIRLEDISQTGFRIAFLPISLESVPLRIQIPGLGPLTAHIRWQRGKVVGCEFDTPLHVAVFEHIVRQARGG